MLINQDYPSFLWNFHFPLDRNVGVFSRLDRYPESGDVGLLIHRIILAFRAASQLDVGNSNNVWLEHFAEVSAESHRILMHGSETEVSNLLNDPVSSTLFHGFDGINVADQTQLDQPWWRWFSAAHVYDMLLILTQAVGALPLENPEAAMSGAGPATEKLLEALDSAFGFRIDFPNPFRGELGVMSSRGLISTRAVASLHQAWRIAELIERDPEARIVEIGGGLGRNAYYCRQFGLKNYTLVDLPTTNVAQANWLGRIIAPTDLTLWDEPDQIAAIRIIPPEAFMREDINYDIAVNVDSITEFSQATALDYLQKIVERCSIFLSINHEANMFNVRSLMRTSFSYSSASRNPWWIKRGYVEEVFKF